MRLFFLLIGCGIVSISSGQSVEQSLRIQIAYEKAGQYVEQAVATIEAVNKVNAFTTVEYKAGRAVTLLPGFEARAGSTFTAFVEAAATGNEGNTKLKLTAFPNPFSQATTISYYLPTDGKVNLWVTDNQGKVVAQLVQGEQQTAGNHQMEWQSGSISSGMYIPTLEVDRQKISNRVLKK